MSSPIRANEFKLFGMCWIRAHSHQNCTNNINIAEIYTKPCLPSQQHIQLDGWALMSVVALRFISRAHLHSTKGNRIKKKKCIYID